MTASRSTSIPDIATALNRLLATVKWLEDGRIVDFDNNVHLAEAISVVRGQATPHTYIQKIRQGTIRDPRASVIWAIGQVLSERACVDITPDYFYVPATRVRIDRALDLELDSLSLGHRGRPPV
ncbi:hypothetical protein [Lapillicoccus sp.]|uniref:hypothetical protein n=1 Tax=Lapillicoccus sp. TaxID=1909287 RepID=UPI0025F8726D|nr:hypothetical protein [Lapillicoccus sp.]